MANGWRKWRCLLTVAGVSALWSGTIQAQEEPAVRFVGRTAIREFGAQPDTSSQRGTPAESRLLRGQDRAEPRFAERDTHRATESRNANFSVISPYGADDAVAIREQLANGWQEIARLTEHLSSNKAEPDFAHAAVQVIVNDRLTVTENSPDAVVSQHDSQVVIHVPAKNADGEIITDRRGAIEGAAAQAFLQVAQLDRELPTWVTQGLAGYVADEAAGKKPSQEEGARIAVATWNEDKSDRSQPASLVEIESEARDKIAFLLEGNDGRYAMEFLSAIQETLESSGEHSKTGNSPVDALLAQVQPQFEKWQQHPEAQEPIVRGPKLTDEAAVARSELLVLLKLQQRMMESSPTSKVKVVQLPASRTKQSTAKSSSTKHSLILPTSAESSSTPSRFSAWRQSNKAISMESLASFLEQPAHPQAVVDAQGTLILPHEHDRIADLLGLHDRRIVPTWQENRWVLATPINGVQELRGWLEENPDNSERPMAQFSIVKRR
jgi:hypothetical protein